MLSSSHPEHPEELQLVNAKIDQLPIVHPPITLKTDQQDCREYKSNEGGRIRFQISGQAPGIISSNVNVSV